MSLTIFLTAGILVEPPTKTTSSISEILTSASLIAWLRGPFSLSNSLSQSDSNLALEIEVSKCLGPEASAVINGRLTVLSLRVESSILTFSAASVSLCNA